MCLRLLVATAGRLCLVASPLLAFFPARLAAQDNYEIQVYPYETVAPGNTMVELHSHFTIDGSKPIDNGGLPTTHAQHEPIETTHRSSDYVELGFYIFT